ncbi:MAG: hypothetical protein ACTSQK_08430 [Candidatus Heimdallarchaeota archaeon]
MIQFVWIIIKDSPVAGMKFIKISNEEERERLEKFYGWLSGPISEFTDKVQDIILENTKYYYHTNNSVLFVIGADLDETSIPTVFLPELEERFFDTFPPDVTATFDGKDTSQFRDFDSVLVELSKAFDQRKIEAFGNRKELDPFEVLNLPNELQMVTLVLVKMQVVTPDMVSQVTGITPAEVERQLREIYQRGYLYITTISNKPYFSIKPFGSEESSKVITRKTSTETSVETSSEIALPSEESSQPPLDIEKAFSTRKEVAPKFSLDETQAVEATSLKSDSIESAMMPPPSLSKESGAQDSTSSGPYSASRGEMKVPTLTDEIKPKLADALEPDTDKKESKGVKLKVDPIAQEIDRNHKVTIIIPKNGSLPPQSLQREKGYVSGKIRIPNDRNKDPFLLNSMIKKDLENIFEALLMGDLIVITGNTPEVVTNGFVDKVFETLTLLSPHRSLRCMKSDIFVHPKDADVVYVPKHLLKYYSWATIIDLDIKKVTSGSSSDFSRNLVKKLRKMTDSKELLREVTNTSSILLKVGRDINTLKIEGRSPDLYLNEVKKTFGVATLEAGLTLSEKLIRLHKDCAYIAGFYIRKGLDIIVRAIVIGYPVVVIGDDPLDVLHVIEALSIFAPHKAINAQIWTTNFAGINLKEFDLMGAQEGTDKLFREAVKVNLRSMSAYGGPRSEFLHELLRKMWRRRSKERPKFIRDNVNRLFNDLRKIVQTFEAKELTKQEIRDLFNKYEPHFHELVIDVLKNDLKDIATKIKQAF